MALRLSGAIMELAQLLQAGRPATEQSGRQQVALDQEGRAVQPAILALGDHLEHALVSQFQIAQKNPLKLTAPVRLGRGGAALLEGQAEVAAEHFGPKGLGAAEKTLGQAFDLPDAELLAAQCRDEPVDVGRRL